MASPEEQFAALAAEAATKTGPIHMINLLKYKDTAEYDPGQIPDGGQGTGEQAYQTYAGLAGGFVNAVGGGATAMSASNRTVLGPDGEDWDLVIIVRYPSRSAFIEMVTNPEYQAITHHRTAALAASRLILTEPE